MTRGRRIHHAGEVEPDSLRSHLHDGNLLREAAIKAKLIDSEPFDKVVNPRNTVGAALACIAGTRHFSVEDENGRGPRVDSVAGSNLAARDPNFQAPQTSFTLGRHDYS